MDIGLPRLNGFEAARQIGALVSSAKIVFLTQETDVDVVREAFNLGGWGYVLKQDTEAPATVSLSVSRCFAKFWVHPTAH